MDEPGVLLHRLRLRGRLEVGSGAETGGSASALIDAGFANLRGTHLVLTPAGRMAAEDAARLPDGSDDAGHVRSAYDRFLPLNSVLLQVCHDWQVLPGGTANDHRDRAHDAAILDRLGTLDDRAGPIARRLGSRVPRFVGYRMRLADARRRTEEGEHEWFASPRVASYHTVWMELHEDLLLALGVERGQETEAAAGNDR